MLLQVRSALRRGELVLALIDRQPGDRRHARSFHAKFGDFHVADGLLRVAGACGARTLFMMSATDDSGAVCITITAPASGPLASPEALLLDFGSALVEHVARM
jgi:hypothetical protein